MSLPRVLVTRPYDPEALELLRRAADVDVLSDEEAEDRDRLLAAAEGRDAILSLLTERIDAEVMDRAPRLRVIANMAVGYDNIDVAAARARGIVVAHTPDVLTGPTADLAVALLLAAARRIPEADRFVRAGRFQGWEPDLLLGREVSGQVAGIVGLGRIGAAVARRLARGFDMSVLYWNRSPRPALERELGLRRVELDELLAKSDFVSLHVALTPETRHLIDRERLASMKPSAVLVNTARGAVIDEAALADALRAGRPGAAGLDVYEREPAVTPELLELDNVVLLPHLGSSTPATRHAMAMLAARNVVMVLEGRRLITEVPESPGSGPPA
ncbi:MAG TPA: D-glycerate dehydrogenase [Thermoanaerobaculia bacterium]|nr:D-glycerate dehydrogenase [Thermoanaerobaculia bacterium]